MQIFGLSFTGERRNNRIPVQRITSNPTPPKQFLQVNQDSFYKSENFKYSTELQFYTTLKENYFKLPYGCEPDEYQIKAASKLYKGEDVLVTAPTGTGKTAIAYYVITKNLSEGKKTFYTTPLKALSNQKYREMQQLYGKNNVGLLTGDVKENQNAPIIVMTTEIYRNMLMSKKFQNASSDMSNLKTVIFDELHYLGDIDRGGVWEQSIILTDKNVQLLSLSATVGNNKEINDWMAKIKGKKSNLIDIPQENRHVPLIFDTYELNNKNMQRHKLKRHENPKKNIDIKKSFVNFISTLNSEKRLPAILFIFSKNFSKKLLDEFNQSNLQLTSGSEQNEIQNTINRYKQKGIYLGESLNISALLKGYALHNSGFLPAQKMLVEELFQKKLIKLVIATETLSAGINMPAKTVIISSARKPASVESADDDGKRQITANEFHQMAGRAGRRGIDEIGYVYTTPKDKEEKEVFDDLTEEQPNPLESRFYPDYSFVASYCKNYHDDELIKTILKKSLYAYDQNPQKTEKKYLSQYHLFEEKRNILKNFAYINPDNTLSNKGLLLAKLNGYQQLPIIDAIYSKKFAEMNPLELAACVSTIANIEKQDSYNKEEQFFDHKNEKLSWFIDDFDAYLYKYNKNNPQIELIQNKDAAKHIYYWAELNEKNSNSKKNWQEIYNSSLKKTIKDEGTLFREIIQTADLLKQIGKISQKGYQLAQKENNQNDMQYYLNLSNTIKKSLDLILRQPVKDSA